MADIAYYGGYSNLYVDVGAADPVLAEITNAERGIGPGYAQGETVWVSWRPEDTLLFAE